MLYIYLNKPGLSFILCSFSDEISEKVLFFKLCVYTKRGVGKSNFGALLWCKLGQIQLHVEPAANLIYSNIIHDSPT